MKAWIIGIIAVVVGWLLYERFRQQTALEQHNTDLAAKAKIGYTANLLQLIAAPISALFGSLPASEAAGASSNSAGFVSTPFQTNFTLGRSPDAGSQTSDGNPFDASLTLGG